MLTVKRGDTYPITFTANMDLSGATIRLLAKPPRGAVITLPAVVTDAVNGKVEHTLTGTLPVGIYYVELEVTHSGVIITFPSDNFEQLSVISDLG